MAEDTLRLSNAVSGNDENAEALFYTRQVVSKQLVAICAHDALLGVIRNYRAFFNGQLPPSFNRLRADLLVANPSKRWRFDGIPAGTVTDIQKRYADLLYNVVSVRARVIEITRRRFVRVGSKTNCPICSAVVVLGFTFGMAKISMVKCPRCAKSFTVSPSSFTANCYYVEAYECSLESVSTKGALTRDVLHAVIPCSYVHKHDQMLHDGTDLNIAGALLEDMASEKMLKAGIFQFLGVNVTLFVLCAQPDDSLPLPTPIKRTKLTVDMALPVLLRAFAPQITSRCLEKLILLLVLASSSGLAADNLLAGSTQHSNRTAIHLLLIGDPGTGKSSLLKGLCDVWPRTVYVDSQTASIAGTSSAKSSGDIFTHASYSTIAVDEIDKHPVLFGSFVEPMLMQSHTVNKAGRNCSNECRCAVAMACNPPNKQHVYDFSLTADDNMKKHAEWLPYFDIVCPLAPIDMNAQSKRAIIGKHVARSPTLASRADTNSIQNCCPWILEGSELRKLHDYIYSILSNPTDTAPTPELVADAWHSIAQLPLTALPCSEHLVAQLRKSPVIKTHPRPLSVSLTIVRIALAFARLEGRIEATDEDVDLGILLYEHLAQVCQNYSTPIRVARSRGQGTRLRAFSRLVTGTCPNPQTISREWLVGCAKRVDSNISSPEIAELIEALNAREGIILKNGDGTYRLL